MAMEELFTTQGYNVTRCPNGAFVLSGRGSIFYLPSDKEENVNNLLKEARICRSLTYTCLQHKPELVTDYANICDIVKMLERYYIDSMDEALSTFKAHIFA